MIEIIFIVVLSLILTALATPFTIKIANSFELVDDPNKNPHPKKVHHRVIPRAGGLAIYFGILVTSLIFLPYSKSLVGILLGITILLIVGLLDDKLQNFSPYTRLVLLFISAVAAVSAGIGISFISNPFYGFINPLFDYQNTIIHLDQIVIPIQLFGPHNIILLADLLAFLWIVSLTQVINWSKGVDGQMPGITLIASLTLGIFSYRLFLGGDLNQLEVAKLAFITAGASAGFLIFNWHPSRIMPGFSGSTILAFMVATISILSGAKLATAILVLAIPIIDFLYTIFRRISQGKSPVWGDRGHLHHRLLDLGWTHPQISLFYIFGSAMLGTVALLVPTGSKLFTLAVVAILFFVFILWLNSFGELSKKPDLGNG